MESRERSSGRVTSFRFTSQEKGHRVALGNVLKRGGERRRKMNSLGGLLGQGHRGKENEFRNRGSGYTRIQGDFKENRKNFGNFQSFGNNKAFMSPKMTNKKANNKKRLFNTDNKLLQGLNFYTEEESRNATLEKRKRRNLTSAELNAKIEQKRERMTVSSYVSEPKDDRLSPIRNTMSPQLSTAQERLNTAQRSSNHSRFDTRRSPSPAWSREREQSPEFQSIKKQVKEKAFEKARIRMIENSGNKAKFGHNGRSFGNLGQSLSIASKGSEERGSRFSGNAPTFQDVKRMLSSEGLAMDKGHQYSANEGPDPNFGEGYIKRVGVFTAGGQKRSSIKRTSLKTIGSYQRSSVNRGSEHRNSINRVSQISRDSISLTGSAFHQNSPHMRRIAQDSRIHQDKRAERDTLTKSYNRVRDERETLKVDTHSLVTESEGESSIQRDSIRQSRGSFGNVKGLQPHSLAIIRRAENDELFKKTRKAGEPKTPNTSRGLKRRTSSKLTINRDSEPTLEQDPLNYSKKKEAIRKEKLDQMARRLKMMKKYKSPKKKNTRDFSYNEQNNNNSDNNNSESQRTLDNAAVKVQNNYHYPPAEEETVGEADRLDRAFSILVENRHTQYSYDSKEMAFLERIARKEFEDGCDGFRQYIVDTRVQLEVARSLKYRLSLQPFRGSVDVPFTHRCKDFFFLLTFF